MASLNIDSTKFHLLESVKLYIRGDSTNTKSLINEYLAKNTGLLESANLRLISQVSSWAIVIDVTWKNEFFDVRKQGSNPSEIVWGALGTTGDMIAVLVNVDKAQYLQGALRIARTVTRA